MINKKILQINTVINYGSTGRIAEEIGINAIQNSWESYIAYGRNDSSSKSFKIKIGNYWDIRLHGLKTILLDRHGFGSRTATHNFIKEIQKIKPNIIHLHNLHGYYLNVEILFDYLNSTKIPLVWTLHDCWPMTGHCTHFTFVGCNKWRSHCEHCPQKKEYPASLGIDNSYNNFAEKKKIFTGSHNITIVPVSNWLAEIVKESFLYKYPIKVIHNGIDLNIFKQKNVNKIKRKYQLNNKFVILGVANIWNERKGFKDFIELNNLLNDDEVIILVGLSKDKMKILPEGIIPIERTENVMELADLYSAADVFMNPTWEDSFPTTNLESLACGTPVITYKTGGSSEAIDQETGIVVEQGNLNGLIKAISKIKGQGKQFYTDACVSRARRLYRKEDRYNEYIELYEEILKEK